MEHKINIKVTSYTFLTFPKYLKVHDVGSALESSYSNIELIDDYANWNIVYLTARAAYLSQALFL